MRVAVFSTPRTCSTFMCKVIANRFNLFNYNESMYGEVKDKKNVDRVTLLKTENDYVVKLFSKYFDTGYINFNKFDWNIFDYVFITQRQNLTEQMASLYNIHYKEQQYINFFDDEVITLYNNQKKWLKLFYVIKEHLLQNHKNVFVIDYEGLQKNPIRYLNDITKLNFCKENLIQSTKPIKVNYCQQYTNYEELAKLVNSWDLTN